MKSAGPEACARGAMSRRHFIRLGGAAGAGLALARPGRGAPPPWPEDMLGLRGRFRDPVRVASLELLRHGKQYFVRARSADGAEGVAAANERAEYLFPIVTQKVIPFFKGKDARDLESLVDGVYAAGSNYKLAGLALWNAVGWVEFALFDLLGRTAGKPVHELLGGAVRKEIPVYLSSMRRDTTPEQEVAWVGARLAETDCAAVKLKIGGRMSRNADAAPGRTEKLVALARKTWGDKVVLHVDANGSYDAPKAIEVGRMLEGHGVYLYEEPCPWEDFESTRAVARALDKVLVAGGEQDTSHEKFAWYVKNRGLDVLQPDVNYNGGFIRTLRVARLAAAAGLDVTPHAPQGGMSTAYMLHFAAAAPNLGRFQEFNAQKQAPLPWLAPAFAPRAGRLPVPDGPGLGLTIDPAFLAKAEAVSA